MNAKTKLAMAVPIPAVRIANTKSASRIIPNHFQSPLNNGGKIPKKNTVQEKPTLTCLT